MDISAFDTRKMSDKGFEFCILDKNSVSTDIFITVRGVDSDIYQAKKREQQRQYRDRGNKNPRKIKIFQPVEQSEEEDLDLLVAATISWRGMTMGGVEFPFSEDNARLLYMEYPEIRSQVEAVINDRTNFFPSTATPS